MTGKFEIDDEGFKTQMSEVPLWRLVQEIISNCFDEKPVKTIKVDIAEIVDQNKDRISITIEDDGTGFRKISDIFTLYGHSYKRSNPDQAGRYNEGEKRFLAVAQKGVVKTKDVCIAFTGLDRVETKIPKRKGTLVNGVFDKKDFDGENILTIVRNIRRLAVPEGKELYINARQLPHRPLVKKFKAELYTVKEKGPKQKLIQIKRETWVYLYDLWKNEKPIIYERGIPVQELSEDLKWHVDIRQKIPQTTDRNVVSDKYLHRLYGIITENTIDLIEKEDSSSNWIDDGLKFGKPEVVKQVFKKRFGTDQVMIRSTSDSEANERAESAGVKLISGSDLDPQVRKHLKDTDVIKMAGLEYKTNHFEFAKHVEQDEKLEFFAKVVKAVALDTIKKNINVNFVTTSATIELAQYGGNTMTWNVKTCGGKSQFDINSPKMLGIMTHELAHDKYGQNEGVAHLSHDYLHEMERIAGIIESKGITYWIIQVRGVN